MLDEIVQLHFVYRRNFELLGVILRFFLIIIIEHEKQIMHLYYTLNSVPATNIPNLHK